LKVLQENLGKTLEDAGINNSFLNRTPIAQEIKASVARHGGEHLQFQLLSRQ
jgi:hypothetical protein